MANDAQGMSDDAVFFTVSEPSSSQHSMALYQNLLLTMVCLQLQWILVQMFNNILILEFLKECFDPCSSLTLCPVMFQTIVDYSFITFLSVKV